MRYARPRKLAQATDASHLEASPSPIGLRHSARPWRSLGFFLRIVALRKTRKRPIGRHENARFAGFTNTPGLTSYSLIHAERLWLFVSGEARFRVGVEQQARRANAMIGLGDAIRHQTKRPIGASNRASDCCDTPLSWSRVAPNEWV